jgi:hypothetical protein
MTREEAVTQNAMDYEKAYKAVLETATKWIEDGCTDKERICLESVFPELRESEDERNERIRKAIVHLLTVASESYLIDATGFKKEQFLSYLEKQKEQDKCPEFCVRSHCIGCTIYEKQKEQKLNLTAKGKGVYKICPHCKSRMIRDDSKVYTSMPPQYGYNCPKCGTMEFDTVMYDNPEMEEQIIDSAPLYTIEQVDEKIREAQEWSDEDERKYQCIRNILLTDVDKKVGSWKYSEILEWYEKRGIGRYTNSQPHWKPSKEQMEALNALNCHGDLSYVGQQNQLISLYNDLKKLI